MTRGPRPLLCARKYHKHLNTLCINVAPTLRIITSMRHLALLAILLAGCSSTIGESSEGTADARPIDFREPPEPKEGSGTRPGCEGVTARGECQQGTAVYCDLDRGRLRQVDCEALGQNCIVDIGRGAVCKTVEEDTGEGSGAASACSDTGISETGFCSSEGAAVYCDTSGAAPVTRTWDCASEGMTCGVGECAEGAFCCGGTSPEEGPDCGSLDFLGTCDGDTARWCDPNEGPKDKDCAATGQRCEVDTCAFGAFCCGEVTDTGGGTSEAAECAALGFEGECSDNLTVRFCSSDEIVEVTCSGTRTCQVDACINGAGCCEPPADPPANECGTLGFEGECTADGEVRFCDGTTDDDIVQFSCATDTTCQIDVCGDGAYCCPEVDPCDGLDAVGVCDGDTLKYCTNGNYTETDCTTDGKTCQVDTCFSGFANCCE